jgi:hypothetical protein
MAQQATGHPDVHEESHGHSLASWMLVALVLVGTFVVCLAIVLELLWLAIIGVVICAAGVVVGRLLQMAGFGVHKPVGKAS